MDGFKQRIIGAIVLISLAVIFVPMLFDEPHTDRTSQSIDLPEEPAFPKVDAQQPDMATKSVDSSPGYRLEEESGEGTNSSPLANSSSATQSMSQDQGADDMAASEPPSTSGRSAEPVQPAKKPAQQTSKSHNAPADVATGDSASSSSETASGAEPEIEAQEFNKSLEGAWLVQLGSFGNEGNAQRLRDNVRKAGYAAHTQTVKRGDKNLTRVFSGPYAAKSDANDAKQALDKAFSVNSLVIAGDK